MEDKLYSLLPFVFIIVIIQAIWIFYDARQRREKHYWLWGFFGLLNFPTSLIVYLLVTRNIDTREKSKCPDCGVELKNAWHYCPYCSRKIKK